MENIAQPTMDEITAEWQKKIEGLETALKQKDEQIAALESALESVPTEPSTSATSLPTFTIGKKKYQLLLARFYLGDRLLTAQEAAIDPAICKLIAEEYPSLVK